MTALARRLEPDSGARLHGITCRICHLNTGGITFNLSDAVSEGFAGAGGVALQRKPNSDKALILEKKNSTVAPNPEERERTRSVKGPGVPQL